MKFWNGGPKTIAEFCIGIWDSKTIWNPSLIYLHHSTLVFTVFTQHFVGFLFGGALKPGGLGTPFCRSMEKDLASTYFSELLVRQAVGLLQN